MQLHEVEEVIEVTKDDQVSQLVMEGWKLIAVVAGDRWSGGFKSLGPVYVLGRKVPGGGVSTLVQKHDRPAVAEGTDD